MKLSSQAVSLGKKKEFFSKRFSLLLGLAALSLLLPGQATAQTIVNTTFVINDAQTTYTPDQIWVTFAGTFTDSGSPQTAGTTALTDSTWQSFNLTQLLAPVDNTVSTDGTVTSTPVAFFDGNEEYTFSLNDFSGRVYINYGSSALTVAPNPGDPGTSPYIVFEPTVLGTTLAPPAPTASNMDLSYVDGVSAPAGTGVRDGTTGASLAATSNNPITTNPNILNNVAALVPAAADVYNGNTLVRVMSSAADPSAYHSWDSLLTTLETTTATTPLNVSSYTSPLTGPPPGLNGALFGYAGTGTVIVPGAPVNFNAAQSYNTTTQFVTNMTQGLNSTQITALAGVGITSTTAGAVITGSGSVAGNFQIFITNSSMEAGTGIYGNNPGYYVMVGNTLYSYSSTGIQNDLAGRVVGDLMAGIVFGWSNSTVNIATWAASTGTNLYGATFSSTTVGGLSTGEYFYLLSLAAAQGKLSDWIGSNADSNLNDYDEYLAAVTANTDAYASGFTDRLQGPGAPGTFWYTANPPANVDPPPANYQTAGFVEFDLDGPSSAPEPSTISFIGLSGLLLLLLHKWRKPA